MNAMTKAQRELTEYYGEDIVHLVIFWHEHDGMTWRRIARRVHDETGYRLSQATFASWASYERNGR